MTTSFERAQRLGRQAGREGKSQNDNPYNPKKPGARYDAELAIAWNHAFCEQAYGTTVFD